MKAWTSSSTPTMLEEKILVVVVDIKASKNLKFCIATTKQYLDNGSMKDTWIGSWEKNGRTWSLLEVFKEACLKSWSTTQKYTFTLCKDQIIKVWNKHIKSQWWSLAHYNVHDQDKRIKF